MAVTDIILADPTEMERIERWRAEELERAGYEPRAAGRLAVRHDVDLHVAVDLLSAAAQRIWPSESCSSQQASRQHGRITARARLDPLAAHRHHRHRSARAAHVRADAPPRDRGVRRAHRGALGQSRRRLGPRVPGGGLGRRGRDRRRPALPRRDELERGARPQVEGRSSRSGRAASASGAGSSSAASQGRSSSTGPARA